MASTHDECCVKTVQEGKAKVMLPSNVFYNPVQEFNRDLSIAIISQYSREYENFLNQCMKKTSEERNNELVESSENLAAFDPKKDGLKILEALAATGLRSIRFALEIPGVRQIVANDFDKTAVEYISKNADANGVGDLILANFSDASLLMYQSRLKSKRFDVIDLDPYGSPSIFLDATVQCVSDGGLLCITCTDMAVLCGNATETCHAKYGSTSLKAKFCHEMALRIILRSIESHANRYSRYIVPLLSISVDFYCRVFVRVFTSPQKVKESASKLSMIYCCNTCGMFALQPLCVRVPTKNENFKNAVSTGPPVDGRCKHCNGRYNLGGPIWSAPIHDVEFVRNVIADLKKNKDKFGTGQRMLGVLSVVAEELVDQPLFYRTDHLCAILHCEVIGFIAMRSALLNAGYKVSLSHADKNSIKTDAPAPVIWDILRCWVRNHPVRSERLQEGSAARIILSKEPTFEADFTGHPDANPSSRLKGLVRWQLNPEKDWGPKPRAGRNVGTVDELRATGETKSNDRKSKRKNDSIDDMKKYVCKRYKKGQCKLGEKCVYSHLKDSGMDVTSKPAESSAINSEEVKCQ